MERGTSGLTVSRRELLAAAVAAPVASAVVVLEARSGRQLYSRGRTNASARPGSTMKPFTALSLAEPADIVCPATVRVASRNFNCSHPVTARPLNLSEALAWSCNAYFVNSSRMLDAASFAVSLRKFGFDVRNARTPDELALLAIGEWGVRCSVVELAQAYRKLAANANRQVHDGLIAATDYGTARLARPAGVVVAGKTGTSATHAWFAGWAPAVRPSVVVTVFVPGGRGGAHAAPIARDLFERWA